MGCHVFMSRFYVTILCLVFCAQLKMLTMLSFTSSQSYFCKLLRICARAQKITNLRNFKFSSPGTLMHYVSIFYGLARNFENVFKMAFSYLLPKMVTFRACLVWFWRFVWEQSNKLRVITRTLFDCSNLDALRGHFLIFVHEILRMSLKWSILTCYKKWWRFEHV